MTVHMKSQNESAELVLASLLHFPCLGSLTYISACLNAGQMVFIYSGSAKGNTATKIEERCCHRLCMFPSAF